MVPAIEVSMWVWACEQISSQISQQVGEVDWDKTSLCVSRGRHVEELASFRTHFLLAVLSSDQGYSSFGISALTVLKLPREQKAPCGGPGQNW